MVWSPVLDPRTLTRSVRRTRPAAPRQRPHPQQQPPVGGWLTAYLVTAPFTPVGVIEQIVWTAIPTKYITDRDVYCSSTFGSDAHTFGFDYGDGTFQGEITRPFSTLAAALVAVRDNTGDRLWLRKTDIWTEAFGTWTKSGVSSTRPLIVGSYGTGARPILRTGSSNCVRADSIAIHDVWFMDFEAYAHTYNGTDTLYGFAVFDRTHSNLLFENLHIHDYRYGLYLAGNGVGSVYTWLGMATNFTVRGCTISNCHRDVVGYTSAAGVSAGIYTYNVNGLLVEFCCLDRNGYNNATYINFLRRNIYHDNVNLNAHYRNNLLLGTDGIQLRGGGEFTNNLISQACSAITLGAGTPPVNLLGVIVNCDDNVILEGQDTPPAAAIENSGITISNVVGGTIKRNIIANGGTVNVPRAWWFNLHDASYNYICSNTDIQDNIAHDWGGYGYYFDDPITKYWLNIFAGNVCQNPTNPYFYAPEGGRVVQSSPALTSGEFAFLNNSYRKAVGATVDVREGVNNRTFAQWFASTGDIGSADALVTYSDPGRTVASYSASIGGGGTHAAFEAVCVAMDRDTWDSRYTAPAVNRYIRAGFDR